MAHLSIQRLHSLVSLDAETGRLFWKHRTPDLMLDAGGGSASWRAKRWNDRYAGKEAFVTAHSQGYLKGIIDHRAEYAHRVVFAITFGRWPTLQIDHINGDRRDNRPLNLREVTNLQNGRNQGLRKNNTSGMTGVYFHPQTGKWRAQLSVLGKQCFVGCFDSAEEAVEARRSAQINHGFEAGHGLASRGHTVLSDLGRG